MEVVPSRHQSIVFYRRLKTKTLSFPVSPLAIDSSKRHTGIGKRSGISTVEHFLAACYGLSLAGLDVFVDGSELPIGDGSASFFVQLFLQAGRKRHGTFNGFVVHQPVFIRHEKSAIFLFPYAKLRVLYFLYPPAPCRQAQVFDFVFTEKNFIREIAPARTFCTYREIRWLRKNNLGSGGNLQNTLVLTSKGSLNKARFPDEPVRHKILDLLGDLCFFPSLRSGFFLCIGSGHATNHKLVRRLAEQNE